MTDAKQTTITLNAPIPYGGDTLTKLVLRRPTAGDLRGINITRIQDMDVDATLQVASRTCVPHVVPDQLAALDPSDFIKVVEAVGGFFTWVAPSPTTPEAPGDS